MTATPNHALQRLTAPGVTAPAPRRPAMQEPRRPPPSLSLGSFAEKMNPLLSFLFVFLFASTASAADKPTFDCTVGGHKIQVILADQPFKKELHQINYKEGGYGAETLFIDGREPVGSDNQIPNREWKTFRVLWDGAEKPIAPKLYRDYYDTHFEPSILADSGYGSLKFIVDPQGQWVQILMFGSDGGGSYVAAWQLNRDGNHKVIDPKIYEFSN